ncbi:MAG: T9SS type A sorting domain-containing protein [Bacteroidetes bacterium]|nr:T9SS type A sorting domain-containing protein [Bacteroidota bacterium]
MKTPVKSKLLINLMIGPKQISSSFLLLFLCISYFSYSQTGSSSFPFTTLGQARNVTGSGIYYFNLSGTTFSTYVNNGWVLIASDYGSTPGVLPKTATLSNSQRGILKPGILAALTSTNLIKVSTSDGNVNDSTNSIALISRMVHDSSLNLGKNDIALNSGWVGSGIYASSVKGAGATGTSVSLGAHLDSCIFWPDGDGSGFHWISSGGYHREKWSTTGEAPSTVAFALWVQAPSSTLPITIASFDGNLLSNNTIQLNWTTSTELNSHYFIVQKSSDGNQWSDLTQINAQGNSNSLVNYGAMDYNPSNGNNYYRLEEVDLDGAITYSKIVVVAYASETAPSIFPNPTHGIAYLKGNHLGNIRVFSLTGQDITSMVKQQKQSDNLIQLDFASVAKGIYFIKGANYLVKEVVE